MLPASCRISNTPGTELSKVPCVSAELLAERIVRLEFLAKLSTRYKTIQSVSKKHIRYCSSSLLQYGIFCRCIVVVIHCWGENKHSGGDSVLGENKHSGDSVLGKISMPTASCRISNQISNQINDRINSRIRDSKYGRREVTSSTQQHYHD